jgi:hypothetical protein
MKPLQERRFVEPTIFDLLAVSRMKPSGSHPDRRTAISDRSRGRFGL